MPQDVEMRRDLRPDDAIMLAARGDDEAGLLVMAGLVQQSGDGSWG